MKKIIIFYLLIYSFNALAQTEWAPIGARWTFGVGEAWSSAIYYREWTSTKDTLVGGHTCKLIKRTGTSVTGDLSDKLITYEDSNKVYWFNPVINKFTTLYDFNKNSGDTWTMQIDTCGLLITVDSTDIETINGLSLKVLYISAEDNAFNGKVVQHIGHLSLPNPNIVFHCYRIMSDANYYTGLRCYQDSILGFHDFNIAPSCDYVVTGISDPDLNSNFNVYPNPTANLVYIEYPSELKIIDVSLYSLSSQYLISSKNIKQNMVDLSSIPSGIYILRIQTDKTVINKMIIKK